MNDEKVTCLVTIHGIGQQQPPTAVSDGYADSLHRALLQTTLGNRLLERDPLNPQAAAQPTRPIYVVGAWPPQPHAPFGLQRLGTWTTDDRRSIDTSQARLGWPGRPVVHLAICYADEQAQGTHPISDLETAVRAALGSLRYATVGTLLRAPLAGLGAGVHAVLDAFRHGPVTARPATDPLGGVAAVLGYLDDDVALYVCRNDLRERVRSFVHDALLRLCCRDDVEAVVVNAHSNGTVIAADVLHQLPPIASRKIAWLVTAGSPLRKYVDLFDWGTDFFCSDMGTSYIPQVKRWKNFWDASDVVADPLAPPEQWRRGEPIPAPARPDPPPATPDTQRSWRNQWLFGVVVPGNGETAPIEVEDVVVHNVAHTPAGGYPPHNYWDNQVEVVPALASIVEQVCTGDLSEPMVRFAADSHKVV